MWIPFLCHEFDKEFCGMNTDVGNIRFLKNENEYVIFCGYLLQYFIHNFVIMSNYIVYFIRDNIFQTHFLFYLNA